MHETGMRSDTKNTYMSIEMVNVATLERIYE